MMFDDLTGMNRRHFLKHLASASMTLPMWHWMNTAQAAYAKGKSRHKSMILLWLAGGPSTIDMWDLKPGSRNGGEFRPINTTGAGKICEHLPRMAQVMKHLNIIRTYNSRDGAHERGTYINHAAFAPVASVVHPAIGAVVAKYNTPETAVAPGSKSPEPMTIPGHISLGGPGVSPGFLGTMYAPFRVGAGNDPIPNLKSPLGEERFQRRKEVLKAHQDFFVRQNRGKLPADHAIIYDRAFKLMTSKLLDTFKLDREDPRTRERYGTSQFGQSCLLARRLVEVGVPFVEVGFGGWDMHQGIFTALAGGGTGAMQGRQGAGALPVLDQGFSALVEDLVQRGLWDSTVVVCMGDFGRTPRINQDTGRDHWPGPWSVVLGGGGMKGGEVVGKTDPDGVAVVDRPVEVSNLFATLYKAVGIEPTTELRSPNGRPLKLVGTFGDGSPVHELF